MDFQRTKEQQQLLDEILRFTRERLTPAKDTHGEGLASSPDRLIKTLAQERLLGMIAPAAYGGGARDQVSYVQALMEVSRVNATAGEILAVNNSLYCGPLSDYGSPAQKRAFLPPCTQGGRTACYGMSEKEGDWDPACLQTKARREGNAWMLNGRKKHVPCGALASYAIIAAEQEEEGRIVHFLVDMETSPEIRGGILTGNAGYPALWEGGEFVFRDFLVPEDALLGNPEEGPDQVRTFLGLGLIGYAAQAVGIGRAVQDKALNHVKIGTRQGKPLIESQTMQWKLADFITALDASELLTLKAASLRDLGKPYEYAAAMAKMYASEAAVKAAMEGAQILAHAGYETSSVIEAHLRDARACQLSIGTNDITRMTLGKTMARRGL